MAFDLGIFGRVGGFNIGANIPFGVGRNNEATPKSITDKFKEVKTPGNTINTMMANVTKSGLFSRPYLYRILITPPKELFTAYSSDRLKSIMLNCESLSIPGYTMATKPHKTYGIAKEYVYEKIPENPVTLGFYMSDKMHEFNFFNDWMSGMYKQGRVDYYDEYKSTMTIYQLSAQEPGIDEEDLRVMMKIKLIDAYPKSISSLALGHETTGIQKMTTDIQFRWATYEDYTSKTSRDRQGGTEGALSGFKEIGGKLANTFSSFSTPKFGSIIKKQLNSLPAVQSLDQFFNNG